MTATRGDNAVTGSFSARPLDPGAPGRGGASAPDSLPDPWGVRRAENLLTSLEGVLSARVVTTPLGETLKTRLSAEAISPDAAT